MIGDVHTEIARLEVALGVLRARNPDAIVCVGDVVDGEGDAEGTCELLREQAIVTVRGNHDRWLLMNEAPAGVKQTQGLSDRCIRWLAELPLSLPIPTVSGSSLLCHGVGDDDMAILLPDTRGYALMEIPTLRDLMADPSYAYMICGHTHVRMVRRFAGITVINAGTLHRDFEAGFIEVDFAAKRVHLFDFEGDDVVEGGSLELPDPAPI